MIDLYQISVSFVAKPSARALNCFALFGIRGCLCR